MRYKVGHMLNGALEQTIARQTADVSTVAEERFNKELTELEYAANYLTKHPSPENEKNILAGLDKNNPHISVGLMKLNGEAIHGEMLRKTTFPRLVMAYRGNKVVDFCAGKGLLFAVPIYSKDNNDNVHAIIYRLYSEEILTELFALIEYDSESRILIQDRSGQIIVPYHDYDEKDKELFKDPTVFEKFKNIRKKLESQRAAAVYYDGPKGELFLFGADFPQTNCSMIGYVPWSAVAGSIAKTNMLILVVTALLLLLFLIASVYLFLMNEKAKESDEAKIEADKANEAKSAFLANMSHEIRTPINAVIGMNEMILRECNDVNILKYSQNVAQASESLLSLINDILDFSKIESGKMELIEDDYHLDDVIKNLVNMIKSRVDQKDLEFKIHVDENIPNELCGDSIRIRQVIVNLLTNAVKYTQVGSIDFNVEFGNYTPPNLDIEIPKDGNFILLMFSVKDTGIGIREEDRVKLFRDFERFDSKKNKNIEGTGLGLAITYNLVKMMHGNILVESKYGEGSTFTVIFPQKVVGNAVVGKFEEKLRSAKVEKKSYQVSFIAPDAKILVVDDNEMNLLVATSLLKATQVQVDTALSGMEALTKLTQTKYDLIFLDQMMPSLDGIQTLRLAKEMEDNLSYDAPTIALTANAISGAREMFLREGFTDYLSKPIDAKELEKMMREYLPAEKLKAPTNEEEEKIEKINTQQKNSTSYKYLNIELGLQYSAGMEDMYKDILTMFCNLKDDKKSKIQESFDKEDWNNYTTLVHALKSTSLSIGGEELSKAAKQLEMSGKILLVDTSSELDKHESKEYIKSHNAEAMELYDKLVEEGKNYINGESGMQNAESINEEISDNQTDISELQEAFDNEDWIMYSILLQDIKSDSAVYKQLDMACKMINADFTTDEEKQEAINYIKEHHAEEFNSESINKESSNNQNNISDLQKAFDNKDWIMYLILIQNFKSDKDENINKIFKQINMACKTIISDTTSTEEKQKAVNYIQEHHKKIIES